MPHGFVDANLDTESMVSSITLRLMLWFECRKG